MKRKRAALIINPRAGQNVASFSAILAILEAAGWKAKLALKEYGGHTMKLAKQAAEQKHELVIAYGGDGTLNQVINGVMQVPKQRNVVGLIPGGTANVWASETGIPANPVEAALTLISSSTHRVDLGHVAVEGLGLPGAESSGQGKKGRPGGKSGQTREHFLLMAGLGIDAAVMGHVSKPLKYRVGALAVGASTAKELPAQRPFPVEIWTGQGENEGIHWKGEAIQVIIGNTRLYADIVQMTPDAYIDDGRLDVCVITAGNPLTTLQQIASLLLRHHPDDLTAEYFQGAHFSLRVPASVALQLDGSAVKLKKYLTRTARHTLEQLENPAEAMVTYRFDTLPGALPVAIPRDYQGALFVDAEPSAAGTEEHEAGADAEAEPAEEQAKTETVAEQEEAANEASEQEEPQHLLEQGRKVTVTGTSALSTEGQEMIIAGTITKEGSGEARPVALRISAKTHLKKRDGTDATPSCLEQLHAGDTLIVKGKKNKRGVIKAREIFV